MARQAGLIWQKLPKQFILNWAVKNFAKRKKCLGIQALFAYIQYVISKKSLLIPKKSVLHKCVFGGEQF
jgi:hypothetical protein